MICWLSSGVLASIINSLDSTWLKSGYFDGDSYLKYFDTQKTRGGYGHSTTCKIEEYKRIEVENWVEGYRIAVVWYSGGDQDDMGC